MGSFARVILSSIPIISVCLAQELFVDEDMDDPSCVSMCEVKMDTIQSVSLSLFVYRELIASMRTNQKALLTRLECTVNPRSIDSWKKKADQILFSCRQTSFNAST